MKTAQTDTQTQLSPIYKPGSDRAWDRRQRDQKARERRQKTSDRKDNWR